MYESAWLNRRGKDAMVPTWIDETSGGKMSESAGGMPGLEVSAEAEAYAE
jgi:hypothetical protein